MQLVDKEAQLLEMELVYEQVTRLSQRIQIKAENGKEDTLHLAKKVSSHNYSNTQLSNMVGLDQS